MAFRIEKAVVRGELSNEERGVVTGSIWLAGLKEPLRLRLRGDCLRDLAGCVVRFSNPRPAPDPVMASLSTEQNGVAGEMTASRKVRQPEVSEQEVLDLLEKGQPIPCRIANCLYLEWYSEENGRVVIESADFTVGVGVAAWSMTSEENVEQLEASQQHFQRFLQAITGDFAEAEDEAPTTGLEAAEEEAEDEEVERTAGGEAGLTELDEDESTLEEGLPLDEFEWEQELRDADRRAEAYQEAFEKYRDHPQREKMIAAALGWEDDSEDGDAETSSILEDPLVQDALGQFVARSGVGGEDGNTEEEGESDEPGDEDPFGSHHPLSQRAMDFALALQREAEERGLMSETPDGRDHSPVLSLILHIITLGGKLAGALDGWAQGLDPEPGFIIAMLKRAQVPLNEALHAFDCIDATSLSSETRQWLQSRKRDLFDLRRDIIDLMHHLRAA